MSSNKKQKKKNLEDEIANNGGNQCAIQMEWEDQNFDVMLEV